MSKLSRQQQIARDKIIKSQSKFKPAHIKSPRTRRPVQQSARVYFPAVQPTSSIIQYQRPRESRLATPSEKTTTEQFNNDVAEFQRTKHFTFEELLREADVALEQFNEQ